MFINYAYQDNRVPLQLHKIKNSKIYAFFKIWHFNIPPPLRIIDIKKTFYQLQLYTGNIYRICTSTDNKIIYDFKIIPFLVFNITFSYIVAVSFIIMGEVSLNILRSEWLLLNAICSAISQREQVTFNEMMVMSTLFLTNTLSWIFIVLAHWNNSLCVDSHMSLQSDTSWFEIDYCPLVRG
jgi:hypothetical protein